MFILAYPYALSAKNMDVLPAVFVITPAIFFCCLMSSYRGYYNGLSNMTPTAISQVFEAAGKLIFGLVCAKWVISYGYSRFEQGLTVYGKTVANETEALSAFYPYAAAGAAAGVTLGTVIGLIYLIILHKVKGDNITKTELANAPKPEQASVVAKNIIKFAIPVALSSLVFSITNLIDSITIQNRLEYVIAGNLDFIRNLYATELAGILDADMKNFLYGSYSLSLDFRNLIPSLTMTLGISAIPTLSAAWAAVEIQSTIIATRSHRAGLDIRVFFTDFRLSLSSSARYLSSISVIAFNSCNSALISQFPPVPAILSISSACEIEYFSLCFPNIAILAQSLLPVSYTSSVQ